MATASRLVPSIITREDGVERHMDLFSHLSNKRIVLLTGEVCDESMELCIAQLLHLSSENPEQDIDLYINSPGGSVTAGNALTDCMDYIPNDVRTIGMGQCASMGSLILSNGTRGKRFVTPQTRVMIHQPSGGTGRAQATDIQIVAEEIQRLKENLTGRLADATYGKTSYDEMYALCERDYFMSAERTLEIGLIDDILKPAKRSTR